MTRSTQSGPHSIETAVSLHDQAVAAQEGGDLAKAGELARKSLRILEEVLPPRHPDLANVRNRLASITLEQDNHVKAKSPHLLSVQATNRRWKHGDSYSLKDSLSSPPFSVRRPAYITMTIDIIWMVKDLARRSYRASILNVGSFLMASASKIHISVRVVRRRSNVILVPSGDQAGMVSERGSTRRARLASTSRMKHGVGSIGFHTPNPNSRLSGDQPPDTLPLGCANRLTTFPSSIC